MADSLQSTIASLETAQAQNRRFVADVAHELRTPLTALVAEASMIEGGLGDLPADARRAGELLVADVQRLRDLVEDLMELSRFDAAAEALRLEPVDLERVVGSVIASRLPAATLVRPSSPIIIDADIRRLDRILGNLLDNARTHAPGAPVDVRLERAGREIRITVGDRGPGVAPELLDHLFDRFFKADPSRATSSRGGSGLGLAIAAEHARLLGGSLRARAREGGGLELVLTIPVTEPLPPGDGSDTHVVVAPEVSEPISRTQP
jgi:two-component system sensor histidine kinase MtrB